jgi:hypothetical protein
MDLRLDILLHRSVGSSLHTADNLMQEDTSNVTAWLEFLLDFRQSCAFESVHPSSMIVVMLPLSVLPQV